MSDYQDYGTLKFFGHMMIGEAGILFASPVGTQDNLPAELIGHRVWCIVYPDASEMPSRAELEAGRHGGRNAVVCGDDVAQTIHDAVDWLGGFEKWTEE